MYHSTLTAHSGPSNCGKSVFVGELISQRSRMINEPIEHIVYCAKFRTSIPINIDSSTISFHEGLPTEEMFLNKNLGSSLYVLDDLLDVAFKSDIVSKIFCEGRHRKIGIILITQNLFPPYRCARNISINASYIVLYRNKR